MRDIRFRAWDKATKSMVDSTTHSSWKFYLLDGGSSIDQVWATKDLELMQFTGLKDMNGVEIYSGDIIRLYPDEIGFSYLKEVVAAEDRPTLGFEGSGAILCEGNSSIMLVVGNIHQDKELLEAS